MPHDIPMNDTNSGDNVRVYERPGRWNTLGPLLVVVLTALILLVVLVLLWRQF